MASVKTQLGTALLVSTSSAATELLNVPVPQICIMTLLNSKSVPKHS